MFLQRSQRVPSRRFRSELAGPEARKYVQDILIDTAKTATTQACQVLPQTTPARISKGLVGKPSAGRMAMARKEVDGIDRAPFGNGLFRGKQGLDILRIGGEVDDQAGKGC